MQSADKMFRKIKYKKENPDGLTYENDWGDRVHYVRTMGRGGVTITTGRHSVMVFRDELLACAQLIREGDALYAESK